MSGVVSSSQQQPAEYTLQGVMRFLQIEWQKNERDRIQWEIEKAEMKARIARLEGEKRGNERLIESFVRRINMLEKSLADERAKAGNTIPEAPGEAASSLDISNFKSTALPEDFPLSKSRLEEIEKSRAKSREYLDRCLQEVTYLLVFAQSVPAPQPSQPLDIPLSQMHLSSQQSANSNNMARENGDINPLSKAHDKGNPRLEDNSESSEGSTTSASSSSSRSNSSNSTGVSSDRGSLSPGRRSNNRMGRIIVLEDNVEEDKPRTGLPRINTDLAEESEEQGAGIIRIGEPIVSSSPVDENESWEFEDRSSDANLPQYVD
ncbi:Striatin family-domain-containing protein [Lipomyces orientalis]|uniref:Striatin family-domain-containing protein n=1 Tax=Lipomyces orientalis TaxID=1233043 RepID=A0ACC3TUR2_9ASCO